MNIDEIIEKLQLSEHPEGGFFRETYRSSEYISSNELGPKYPGKRNYATCIYFLLTSNTFSAFHRIQQDEIWHFYQGNPISLHVISEEGTYEKITIGNDLSQNQSPQYVVPGGSWFAAEVIGENTFGLLGCTVAPGFDFMDFELPKRNLLIKKFPQHRVIVERLTRQ